MPVTLPQIDDRRYDDLLGEAIARIPVHTPEWTNFNHSDPGVTLIEVFAFLTESLLYRANQIPERNRKRFLQLLRVPLQTATPAQGLVTIANQAPATNPQPVALGARRGRPRRGYPGRPAAGPRQPHALAGRRAVGRR